MEALNEPKHLDIPWKWIIFGFAALCLIVAFARVFISIAGVFKPYTDILGNIAKSTASLVNDCVGQADCKTLPNCDACKQKQGCGCDSTQTCMITSGKKPGTPGPFGCILSVVTLSIIFAPVIGFIVTAIATAFGRRKAAPEVAEAARNLKVQELELTKSIIETSEADIAAAENTYREKYTKEMSPDVKDALRRTFASREKALAERRGADSLPEGEKANLIQEAKARFADTMTEVDDAKSKLDADDKDFVDGEQASAADAVEKAFAK